MKTVFFLHNQIFRPKFANLFVKETLQFNVHTVFRSTHVWENLFPGRKEIMCFQISGRISTFNISPVRLLFIRCIFARVFSAFFAAFIWSRLFLFKKWCQEFLNDISVILHKNKFFWQIFEDILFLKMTRREILQLLYDFLSYKLNCRVIKIRDVNCWSSVFSFFLWMQIQFIIMR